MKNIIGNTYKTIIRNKENIFSVLIVAILVSGIAYGIILKKTVENVVEREKISKESKTLLTDISDLETKYFSMKNSVTTEIAYAKGFKNPKTTSYISTKDLTAMAIKNEF
jgi:hypothetical protein